MVAPIHNHVSSVTSTYAVTRPWPFAGNSSASCYVSSIALISNDISSQLRLSPISVALIMFSYRIFASCSSLSFPSRTLLLCDAT